METNAWAFHEPLLPKTQSVNCTLIRKLLTKSRAQQKHWAWFSLPVQHIWQSCKEWKSHQECWSPCLLITRQLQSIFTWNIWGNMETRIHCSGTYYLPGIVQMAYTFVSFHPYERREVNSIMIIFWWGNWGSEYQQGQESGFKSCSFFGYSTLSK